MKRAPQPARRRLLAGAAGAALGCALGPLAGLVHAADAPLITRPIPHGGEQLPIVGIGTAVIFNFENDPAAYAERRQVEKPDFFQVNYSLGDREAEKVPLPDAAMRKRMIQYWDTLV